MKNAALEAVRESHKVQYNKYINFNNHRGHSLIRCKEIFKIILEALLDTRTRLPPIYNFRFDNIMVDQGAKAVKIIITDDLFRKESDIMNLERESL